MAAPSSLDAWRDTRVLLIAGGPASNSGVARLDIQDFDRIACADSGLDLCLSEGWCPDLLVGDMDSVSARALAQLDERTEVHRHPSVKAASDLELMLGLLQERHVQSVCMVGVSGGRTDHMLFNWLLAANAQWRFRLSMLDDATDAWCVTATQPLSLPSDTPTVMSVLALGEGVSGLCLEGVDYPLDRAELPAGSTLGLSNVTQVGKVSVSIQTGRLLVLFNRSV